ncbi:hypothetical protein C2845_PM15G09120 [Panicum miliaceum]|uniref:Ubiquitin-like protease family profile domain-containing protein n=1 Tax=Panicum miliaceum TaxID=4540 RepID=A0A3L6QB41_PANMI|nr:hypothetical protein C2845_PM15G09120 [Panicum miliaceum]
MNHWQQLISPSILAELGGFVDQIGSKTWQAQARAAMEKFDAKSKKASSYMNMGQHMLQNAHQEVICNLRAILQEQVNGNIGQDHHHHQPTAFDTGDHPNQDKPMQVQQNRAQEPLLSTPVELHHIHDDSSPRTDDETLHAPTVLRSQRLTRRPTIYVSPFKGDPQRAKVPLTKAHAVRKKFGNGIKCESDIFIRVGLQEFSGSDIIDSFLDEEMLPTEFISYFVACMRHDESVHMADGAGYRVFLSPELWEYVNIEEDEDISQWEAHEAIPILQRDIEDVDPTKVKLFLLPIMEEEHFSVYRINFIHDRIDVLDSCPDDHTEYHQILGDRIIPRLNLLFQLATDYTMKQFTRFKRPITDV